MSTQQQATHSDTNPRSGQYLTHARSHITRAVALWTAVSALLCLISMARVETGLKALSASFTQHMWGLIVGWEPRTRQFSHGMRWEGGSTLTANRGQQSQNSCAWLCGCIRYWPRRGLVFECVTCFYCLLYNKHLVWVNILWIKLTKSSADVTSKSTISANPACFAIWAFTNWSPKKGEQIIGTPW